MDPVVTGMILGQALRQYVIHSKRKEAYRLAISSAERVTEAQLKAETYEQETEAELNKLFTRIGGILRFLEGPFCEVFQPLESPGASHRNKLLAHLLGTDAVESLAMIESLREKVRCCPKEVQNCSASSGVATKGAYLLFGNLGVVSLQVDAARTQRRKAELLATHIDTFCMALELQREQYQRINQTLGALNVALLSATFKAQKSMEKISCVLDESGRVPLGVTDRDMKRYWKEKDLSNLAICANIARCICAILSEPLFGEEAELTQRAQQLLMEGQEALDKIAAIEKGRQ